MVVLLEASGFCLSVRVTECERAVRPMPVVMTGIDAKHVLELAPAEDEQPLETLAPHAADPALGMCVRVRRLHGCADHGDPFALEDRVEAAAELGVAIVDQQAQRSLPIVDRHQQVARLLGCPGAGRVRSAGDELDPAALERERKKST